jgi:hypothetical protein
MEEVSQANDAALEMWGYTVGNTTDRIFVFTGKGNIRIDEAPTQ